MASWNEFKKRFGTAASRDPAVTIGGMFGTEGARKKQKERLSSRAKIDAELARNKRDRERLSRSEKIDAELARNKRDREAQKTPAPALKQEVQTGTSPTPREARPTPVKPVPDATRTVSTPSSAPKPRNYSTETADRLKLGEDSAVTKRLRERAKMSQEERDKPFGEDNEVLKKLRAAGYNFAKGGKINGAARKGKTKGRFI